MSKRILLCLSHSIEESDQLRLLTDIGYEVASIGGFINPQAPHDAKRPPLVDVPYFPEIQKAVDVLGTGDNLGAAQSHIPDAILEWLGDDGIIIYHHYLERLFGQWPHVRDWLRGSSQRRVIWRSVGQSVEYNERQAAPFRREGLERVAYSPKEANIPGYSGHDALIRFYKDPDEWQGWVGDTSIVINITQHLAQREPYTNWGFWEAATQGLPRMPLGPGSEVLGGPGELTYDEMQGWLRKAAVYCYTGTQPASYTLGLLEAGMTGIPIVSIGPSWMRIFPYGPLLFEGHELTAHAEDDPARARKMIVDHLEKRTRDTDCYRHQQAQMQQFTKATVGKAWRSFLGEPAAKAKAA